MIKWARGHAPRQAVAFVALFFALGGGAMAADPYAFSGFDAPVSNPPITNVVSAGQAVPVKFSLGGNQGLNIFSPGSPSLQLASCVGGPGTTVTTVQAGRSVLTYDASTDTYTYTLKTDKSWAGLCGTLSVSLNDGTTHQALFQFK